MCLYINVGCDVPEYINHKPGGQTVSSVKMNVLIIVHVMIVTTKCQTISEFTDNNTLPCGTYDVSNLPRGKPRRILSYKYFDRRSKYYSRTKCQWNLHLGKKCEQMKIFCVFLRTRSNYRCTKGDILTIVTGEGAKRKYCGTKKPTKKYPILANGNVRILWRTDRWKTERGFDCRIGCSKSKAIPVEKCVAGSGPGEGKDCIFLFTWKYTGKTYDGCAFDPAVNIAPWCSTLTVNGMHQSGREEWGFCSPSCPMASGASTSAPTTPPPTISPGIAAGCECGQARKSQKIINGVQTEVNEYPWMVGLSMISSISPICGGALISDQYVLTAAHCCKGKDAERLQVFLGDHDWAISEESDSFRRAVEKITIHPNYAKPQQLNNDVCLLKLSTPISFPDHPLVRPVCLPPNSQTKYGNAEAIVTGWGKVSGDGKLDS